MIFPGLTLIFHFKVHGVHIRMHYADPCEGPYIGEICIVLLIAIFQDYKRVRRTHKQCLHLYVAIA